MEIRGVIENLFNWHSNLYNNYQEFVIAGYSIVLLLIFLTIFLIIKNKKNVANYRINIRKYRGEDKTDLDVLYDLLRDKKELSISEICKVFRIKKDVAMEWGKILESGDLATVDYPGIGEPVIRVMELSDIVGELSNNKKTKSNDSDSKLKIKNRSSRKSPKKESRKISKKIKRKIVKKTKNKIINKTIKKKKSKKLINKKNQKKSIKKSKKRLTKK